MVQLEKVRQICLVDAQELKVLFYSTLNILFLKDVAGRADRAYVRSNDVVILDVGGQKFTALRATLFRFPTTRSELSFC